MLSRDNGCTRHMVIALLFIHLTSTFSTYLHSCKVQMKTWKGISCTWLSNGFISLKFGAVIKILSRFKVAQKPRRLGSCFSSLHLVHLSLEYTHCLPCKGNSSPKSAVFHYLKCAAAKIKCCRTNACSDFHQGQNGHAQQIWLLAGWINVAFMRTQQQKFSYHV